MKNKIRIGMIGFGKIGRTILSTSSYVLSLNLIADKRRIFVKRGAKVFSPSEIRRLIRWKQKSMLSGLRNHDPVLDNCDAIEIKSLSDEIRTLKQVMCSFDNQWAIIDATSMSCADDFKLAEAMIGCRSYCTVNKSLWSDYDNCKKVYQKASRKGTLLGLNCTSGVWADEMESIPLALTRLKDNCLCIEKRDNSSLNSFFALVKKGISADRAVSTIAQRGHLEPGVSNGLANEVQDLVTKTKIVANICGVLTGIKPSSIQFHSSLGVSFFSPKQVEEWHMAGRKRQLYPACMGIIRVDIKRRSIEQMTECKNLPQGHPLAIDCPWKCAFLLRTNPDFGQIKNVPSNSSAPQTYVNFGLGGNKNTASKIIWETVRCLRICNSLQGRPKNPLPILQELEMNQWHAVRLENKIAKLFSN